MINPYIFLILCVCVFFIVGITSFIYHRKIFREEYEDILIIKLSVEQMEHCEEIIHAFFAKNHIQNARSIREIGEKLNVIPNKFDEKDISLLGKLPIAERKFFIAKLCAQKLYKNMPTEDDYVEAKKYTDYITTALLMPLDDLYGEMVSYGYLKASKKERRKIFCYFMKEYRVEAIYLEKRIREISKLKQGTTV